MFVSEIIYEKNCRNGKALGNLGFVAEKVTKVNNRRRKVPCRTVLENACGDDC